MKLARILTPARTELGLYVAALALQRGTLILMVPVVSRVAGIEGLGLFTLAMAAVYFLAPFLSLNGVPAVLREWMEDAERGAVLFYGYMTITAVLALVGAAIAFAWPGPLGGLALLSPSVFSMAFAEAQNQKAFAVLRARGQPRWYLAGSAVRIALSVAAAFILAPADLDPTGKVAAILTLQAAFYVAIGLVLMGAAGLFAQVGARLAAIVSPPMLSALRYTIPMIPHNASLWAINAMGRLFVFRIEGEAQAGYFGGISTIASLCALFNVAMANLLPRELYASFESWIGEDRVAPLFRRISLGFCALYLGLMAASFFDRAFVRLMPIYIETYPLILALLMIGFLWLIPYYFYGNVLVYYRRTRLFSLVTVIALLLALPLFQSFIEAFSLVGAGVATIIVQALHAVGMAAAATLHEPRLKPRLARHFALFAIASVALMISAGMLTIIWTSQIF